MVYNAAMITRQADIHLVRSALKRSRIVALLGPRQCGKTTLARQFVPAKSLNYFDLEDLEIGIENGPTSAPNPGPPGTQYKPPRRAA